MQPKYMGWGAIMMGLAAATSVEAKTASRFVTARMRDNAQGNVEKHDWAQGRRKGVVAAAKRWVEMSDETLWDLITSQELPRAIMPTEGVLYKGQRPFCPKCDETIGGYAWKTDFWQRPWEVQCPKCKELFPKNDFHAFYKSALDEHGMFRRKRGDRSLLVNAEHPDPADPLHKLYVDDGYGMLDEKGRRHHAVATYVQWGHWHTIYKGVSALANAYTLTGERRYAHKAAVLLDRIADVYPEMDFLPLHRMGFQHSQGGSGQGRIEGCIWETTVTVRFAYAYDHIFDGIQDDRELVAFCSRRAREHKLGDKASIAAICRHIEDHLLVEALRSCKDGRIAGNTGMTHTCLAVNAIALDRPGVTGEWLDWLFDPRYPGDYTKHKDPVPWVLVEGLDRDGMGGECGGYGLIWTRHMQELAEILAAYPEYKKHNLVTDYPKLKQSFFVEPRLNCLDAVMPAIGDTSATGSWGRLGRARTFALGYRLYRDPRLAALAWRFAGGKPARLRRPNDIFLDDPAALVDEIARTGKAAPPKLVCEHLGRYGQAVLQTESTANGRAVWIHYGYGKGHSHYDCLNLGLYAENVDMLPDLGYPEYTGSWPKRGAWTSNTISHSTMQIDDARSGYSPGGRLSLFVVEPPLRVVSAGSRTAYTGMKTYARTVALVDVSDRHSYVVDVFRARGRKRHRLSWHGPAETAVVDGIELVEQATGTFAGPDAPFGKLDGKRAGHYRQSGFTYLYDVQRSAGPVGRSYTVDWKAEDLRGRIKAGHEPHLRLHALTPCDEVALASGDPPQNKRGNPRRLRYVIQSRSGKDMASQFVNVLEPYDKTPFIRRVRTLDVKGASDANGVAAVAVELVDGATDVVILSEEPRRVVVEGGIEFDGRAALVRFVGKSVRLMRMAGGSQLRAGDVSLTAKQPAYSGKVVRVDAGDPQDNRVFLDPPLPSDANLAGRLIHFENKLPLDTSYTIKGIGRDWVSTGDVTIVAGFKDPKNFRSGYRYLVNAGDTYVVPCVAALDR